MASVEREQYDAFAEQYTKISALPFMRLEKELLTKAIGDCTNARVLDLGGGAALHARTAIAAGAEIVDLVDISQAMMDLGRIIEEDEGRHGKIRFMLGDVTKSLDHLNLEKQSYDVVMANWVFDHSTSIDDLEAMWQNVATYLKPGGRFVNVRVHNARTYTTAHEKYGIKFEDLKEIPGGLSYNVVSNIEPPLSFEGTSMDVSASGSLEMHKKYGLTDIKSTHGENSDLVQADPTFWAEYLNKPLLAVVTAVRG